MDNQTQNLFIVEDNQGNVLKLHQFLEKRFGTIYNIFTYKNPNQALKKVDENTSVIVLDYGYSGKKGTKTTNLIKKINKKTKVIILSKNDDIDATIDLSKQKGDEYSLKEIEFEKKLKATFFQIMDYPVHYLQQRYSVSKAFVYTVFMFIILSIIVFLGIQIK